jgi:hypothetical protein
MYEESAVKEAGRATDVQTEMKIMDEAIVHLGAYLEKLDTRLAPVLRSAIKDGNVGATPQESRVPLADAIRNQRYAVEHAGSLIDGILLRLHL